MNTHRSRGALSPIHTPLVVPALRRTRLPALALAAAVAMSACTPAGPAAVPTPLPELPAPAAQTYRVQRGLVLRQIEFPARAQPADSETLSFGTDGKVRAVNVKGGDSVKKGDVLAELDLSDIRTQLQQAEIQLRTAETVLSETQRTFTRTLQLAQLDLDQAKLRLDQARARAASPNVAVLKNDLERNAQKIADIQRSIADARSRGNQAGADNAERILKDTQIERERLQANYDSALADARVRSLDVASLENDVKRLQLGLESKVEKVDPQLIQAVESARVNIAAQQEKLSRGSLIAPFDGVVALQPLAVGDTVRALEPAIIVAKPGELEMVAQVSDTQLNQISISQQVSCALASQPNRPILGTITRVPALGNSKDRVVRIQLGEPVQLQTGLLGRCNTTLAKADNTLWLPPNAVRKFRGRDYVVLQDGPDKQRRIDVKIGVEGNDRIEILDGLKDGDVVVAP